MARPQRSSAVACCKQGCGASGQHLPPLVTGDPLFTGAAGSGTVREVHHGRFSGVIPHLASRILQQINSCIKILICAKREILFDLHQQLTSATALKKRIKHNTESLAHVEMEWCLARTAKDQQVPMKKNAFSSPSLSYIFYTRGSSNYAFVRHDFVSSVVSLLLSL